jgi:mono/diheme cytochrome c family protein
MRKLVKQIFFFGFVLGIPGLLWLTVDVRLSAQQDGPQVRPQDQDAIIPLDGAKIYGSYCAACHGISGNGGGPAASALKAKIPNLTTIARRNRGKFPTSRVSSIIAGDEAPAAHGSREMPVWGPIFHRIEYDQDLGNVRLQNVTDFLNSIQLK